MINHTNWMSALRDDVKLCGAVIPSAHNAGTKGMNRMACCQDGDVYEQFLFGIRHYCIRLNTDKNGRIILCHGISKGMPFEDCLALFSRALGENDSEFFIFDVREYYDQKIGPLTLRFRADPAETDRLLEKYIKPSKYAYTDFEDISEVTIGDLRASGKRYILLNYNRDYKYSVDCKLYFPWDKTIYGMKGKKFCENCTVMFEDDRYEPGGLFWFQTQQTPNPGTEIGMSSPRKIDKEVYRHFNIITDAIADNPDYLARANIIAGDFMTADYKKVNAILRLNLLKGNIREDCIGEYARMISE